jgi:xylulokinase
LVGREFGTLDVVSIYDAVLSGIREIVERSGLGNEVEVIGIDGQMGGIVGIDECWRPVIHFDPPINNNYKSHMSKALGSHGDVIVGETASIPINGSKIVYWMEERPGIFKRVRKIVSLSGFVVGKLTGIATGDAFIDHTSLYLFGLARDDRWSGKVCDILKIPASILPRIKEPSRVVGALTKEARRQCGLREGIPLVAGMGDTAASILGAGIIDEGDAVDIAGTCSVFGLCTSKDIRDKKRMALLRMRAPIPRTYYLVGIGFGGGIYSWFLKSIYSCPTTTRDSDELVREAEKIPPGSEGLIFFPFLGGTFTPPDDSVRGMWVGFDWNHSVFHMYRSMLESIAYEYRYYLDIYKNLANVDSCRSVTVTGSGKKNPLWNRIKADVLGIDYVLLKRDDHENFGTALVAAFGINLIDNIGERLARAIEIDHRFSPDIRSQAMYDPVSRFYIRCKTENVKSVYKHYNTLRWERDS